MEELEKNKNDNYIKIGRFEYKSKNFWLTCLCIFLLFILAFSALISYTTLKILDKFFPNNSNKTKIEMIEKK